MHDDMPEDAREWMWKPCGICETLFQGDADDPFCSTECEQQFIKLIDTYFGDPRF